MAARGGIVQRGACALWSGNGPFRDVLRGALVTRPQP